MKPLRDLLVQAPVAMSHNVQPVAILASAARPVLEPDLTQAADRALFGLSADAARALAPEQLHLLELTWEVLETASITLSGVANRLVGLYVAAEVDITPLRTVLGLDGPMQRHANTPAGGLRALSAAAAAAGADDVEFALCIGTMNEGLVVAMVGSQQAANGAGRVGRILANSGASTLAKARAQVARLSGIVAERDLEARDLGAIVLACASKEVTDIHAEDEDGCVVVQLATDRPASADGPPPRLLRLSARSRSSLRELVAQVLLRMQSETDLRSLAVDASRRAPLERRIALPADRLANVTDRLGAWLAGDKEAVANDRVTGKGVGLVFPPAGSQAANVAGSLYDHEPAFRGAVMQCDRLLRGKLPRPLLSLMFPQPGREHPLSDPLVASPITFVLGWSLAQLMDAWGVRPQCVLGAGVGEIVAAVTAEAISLEDGLKLALERGRLLRQVADRGARAVVPGSEEQAREWIEGIDGLDVVAVPVPHKTVVGGSVEAVDALMARAEAQGVGVERVAGHPGHTPLVDPLLDRYRELAATVTTQAPRINWVSSAKGGLITGDVGPEHWVATIRAPIRFAAACEEAYFSGTRTFIELSARPVMVASGQRTLSHLPVRWISALRGPEFDDRQSLHEALAIAWSRGVDLPASDAARGHGAPLPPSHFDRRPLDVEGDDEIEMPLVSRALGATIVPDDPIAAAEGWPSEDFTPPIAPPSLLDDLAEDPDAEPTEVMVEADIATFFGEEATRPVPPPAVTPVKIVAASGLATEHWEPADAPVADTENATWIVLADEGGFGDYLLALLGEAGHRGLRVLESAAYPRHDDTLFVPDPLANGAWDEVIDRLGTISGPVRVVHLWALDERRHREAWLGLVRMAETFRRYGLMSPIYVVTRGVAAEEPSTSSALLWGVGRRLAVEAPQQWGGAIDLDEDEDADLLLAHLLERAAPPEVRMNGTERLARTWVPVDDDSDVSVSKPWLIVGDVDDAGLALAADLVKRGAERVLLLSESAPTSATTMQILDLQRQGVKCTVIRGGPGNDGPWQERLQREGELGGMVMRVAGSTHKLLGRADDVGRKQVGSIPGLTALLDLAPRTVCWMPAGAFDHGDDAPWAAVLGPVVAQWCARGVAIVCLPLTAEAAPRVLPAAKDGAVVGIDPAA